MRFLTTLCLLLMASTITYAEDQKPKAVITDVFGNPPPEKAEVNGVLFLSAGKAIHGGEGTSVKWIVFPERVNERTQSFWDKERGPFIVVPVGSEDVTITVIQFVSLNNLGDVARVTIRCGKGDIPLPTPNPNPTPNPTPNPGPTPVPTPIDAFKVSLQKITPSQATVEIRTKVATAFRETSKAIAAGQVSDITDLLRQTSERMANQVGLNEMLNWIAWRDQMTELLAKEKIGNLAGHKVYWEAIADVLEAK